MPATASNKPFIRRSRLWQALTLAVVSTGLATLASADDSAVPSLAGKRIAISPLGDQDWGAVTGLVLIRRNSATVLFRRTDPRWYQLHTVWHELSHLLFAHPGCGTLPGQHPGSGERR